MSRATSFFGGSVRVGKTSYCIKYVCEKPVALWEASAGAFVATVVASPSGAGKSVLLGTIYDRLRGAQARTAEVRFDFSPDLDRLDLVSVGYVPQNAPLVKHWRVKALLPAQSEFLKCFFPGDRHVSVLESSLGQLSGGECRKLYACSALERLAASRSADSYLLMDETFDGLGASEASRCLSEIQTVWSTNRTNPLHVMVVSHLDESDIKIGVNRPGNLFLDRGETKMGTMTVAVHN